jgi:hypothetical protein
MAEPKITPASNQPVRHLASGRTREMGDGRMEIVCRSSFMSDRRANGAAMEGGPSRPPRSPWAVGPVEAELNPPHQSRWGGGQGTAAKGSCLRFPVRRPPIPPDLNSETRPLRANSPNLNSETRPLRANSVRRLPSPPNLNSETRPLRANYPFARTVPTAGDGGRTSASAAIALGRSARLRRSSTLPTNTRRVIAGGPPRPPLAGIVRTPIVDRRWENAV